MKTSMITMTAVLGMASAQAAVVFTSSTDATIAIASVATDLLQTTTTTNTFPAGADIANGTTGAFNENSASNGAQVVLVGAYDITLDLAANPAGYDISQINSYTGWTDGRAGQSYTISFSTVTDPTTFTQITPGGSTGNNAVNVTASGQSLVTNVFDDTAALLGTGVAVIRFDVGSTSSTGNVWREIDVIGVATVVVPEPSSLALLSLAGFGLSVRRRRA